jgi:hypothetical protein
MNAALATANAAPATNACRPDSLMARASASAM